MNLFTGRNLNNDECIFDVHSFARELDEDTLRTEINGGSCGGDAPSAPSPSGGGNPPSAPAVTTTNQTTNPGTTPQTNSGTQNPSNSSNPGPGYTGGGNEPSPEIMSNPQAYGYWKALQDLAKQQGDPDRYKDYNVVPDYKQNIVDKNSSTTQKEQKSLKQIGYGGRVALIGGFSFYAGLVYNPNDPMDSGIRIQFGVGTGVETGVVTSASNSIKSVVEESVKKSTSELMVDNVSENINSEIFDKPTKSSDLEGVNTNLYASALVGVVCDCEKKQITGIEFGSVGGGVYRERSTVITMREIVDGFNTVVDGINNAVTTVTGWLGW
jgi:hypothetical protein